MDRTTGANRIDIGGGRWGYRDRNLALGQAGTILNAEAANGFQEEIVRLIEGAGITPSAAVLDQAAQALRRLAGGNTRSVTANTTLTADDAGLVLVSAAAGNLTLTLPAANAAAARPLRVTLVRTDSTANTVIIQRAGADTIEGATSTALPPAGRLTLISDGAGQWLTQAEAATGRSYGSNGWQRLPGGLIIQWGQGATASNGLVSITLPVSFTAEIWSVLVTEALAEVWNATNLAVYGTYGRSVAGFSVNSVTFNGTWANRAGVFRWLAVGR